ncbi:M20 family metallopeptidase [Celerinatantimonas sp. YJH-8]|uniref:M20 family metallopeptidase n=1 Tax=Celerinatantimonas sp. YJH-8 TaxID=3228714 RepID=UPI0038C8EA63
MNTAMMDYICSWLVSHQQPMFDLLEKLVNLDSPSHQPELVRRVGNTLIDEFKYYGINAHWMTDPEGGICAEIGDPNIAPICLTGHMDTVFKDGTVAKRPYQVQNQDAYGPGVADMKAGLVMNAYVLAAFASWQQQYSTQLPWRLRFISTMDEEIGSPQGQKVMQSLVAGAKAVFNAEPGRISGNVVSARKGGDSYVIEVHGRASHAGVSHADGVSAIEALARIVIAIHQLTDYEKGITTNIGVIQGGTTPNTVAAYACAKLDVRYMDASQRVQLIEALEQCVARHGMQGIQATLKHVAGFVPFESKMSASLLAIYKQQATQLGIKVDGEFTGGCSDAGWTSAMGIPTLCGTGPVGEKMHTDLECCHLDTFVDRAQIVARCCIQLNSVSE